MKILHIIETLGRGGTENMLLNLLPSLQTRGIKCEVAVLWPPYTLASELEKQGIKIHYLNLHHRWSIIEGIFKVVTLLHKGDFDIIHARLFFAHLYTALSRPFTPSIYRVTSFHNLGYVSYPTNNVWKKFRKLLDSFLSRYWIDSYIAISTCVAEHYSTHLKLQGHVEVIHNGLHVDTLQPNIDINRQEVLACYGVSSDEFIIIVPARLVFEKGHKILLQSLTILREKKLFPRVLIFGDGPLQDELNQILKTEQLLEQVVLHGAIPHTELMSVVQAADIFVLPSIYEGFGLAHAEAMAMAKPVITTRVGGLTDLIENNVSGILVPPKDHDSLANAIAQLMKDDYKREQLGKAARKRIETCFSMNVIADRYVNFYNNLITNQKK